MEYVIVVAGALGAWLLVAGPVYQGALELREQEIDREGIQLATAKVDTPPKLSPWWWLLPPVAYLKQRRRSLEHRRSYLAALEPHQLAQSVTFINKANGWFIVAVGAFFIAFKETWELCELLEWPPGVFAGLMVAGVVLCIANVTFRMLATARILKREESLAELGGTPSA